MSSSKLFQALKVGNATLPLRVAMAPLTRFRSDDEHVPLPIVAEYYGQRGATPGTLLVSEATFMSASSGGYANVPGIYTQAQIDAWKPATDAVHAGGSYIFCQLWDLGRAAYPAVAEKEGFRVKSASALPMAEGGHVPEALTLDEVRQKVRDYAQAAKNAIAAGFDGVELHGANGYLVDQFLQDASNQRTDAYGGSIENRSRFAVEVVDALVEAVGAERVAIRLSPWSRFQGMRMADPLPQFLDLLGRLQKHKLAYVHLVRSMKGTSPADQTPVPSDSLRWAVDAWTVSPVLVCGGVHSAEDAQKLLDEEYKGKDVVAVFGRSFITTPDLPFRLREGIPLNPVDESSAKTFYLAKSPLGYIDYPFSKEFEAKYGARPAFK